MKNAARDTADYKINRAVPRLFGLAAISLIATLAILLAPPMVLGTRLPTQPGIRGFLLYFFFIGHIVINLSL